MMEKLITILADIKPGVRFEECTDLVDKGIVDSIDIVNIISAIETEFGIEIDPDEIDPENFQSADSIWEMIQRIKNK